MSPLVAGDSKTGKDGSPMSLVPHRIQNLKLLEDGKSCISQHLQFEAEKSYRQARVWYPSWGKGTKKVTIKQKKSHNELNPQKH